MPLTICSSQSKRLGTPCLHPFIPYYPGLRRWSQEGQALRLGMVSPLKALMGSALLARTELRGPTGGRLDVAVRNLSYTMLQDTEANDINLITVS